MGRTQIRLPKPWVIIPVIALLAVGLGIGLYLHVSAKAVNKPVNLSGLYWIYFREDLTRLQPLDPSLVGQTLSGPGTYALEHNASGPPLPAGVIPVQLFFSYADQQAAIKNGGILPGVTTLADDPEYWPATPVSEQRNPLTYMQDFAQADKSAGYSTLLVPGVDLMSVPGATCGQGKGQTISQAYVTCGLPGAAANAKIFVIQTAADETNLPVATSLAQHAAAAARAANPSVIVIATISTLDNGVPVSASAMDKAARDMLPYVQGFEVNTTASTDSRYITFLHYLSGS